MPHHAHTHTHERDPRRRVPMAQVARRALLLDAAVDNAADWVQHTDPAIRTWKEEAYLRALEAYRRSATRP